MRRRVVTGAVAAISAMALALSLTAAGATPNAPKRPPRSTSQAPTAPNWGCEPGWPGFWAGGAYYCWGWVSGDRQLTVAPAPTDGNTVTLKVVCTSSNGGTSGTNSAPASGYNPVPIVVTGLTNGAAYSCTAYAENAYGSTPSYGPLTGGGLVGPVGYRETAPDPMTPQSVPLAPVVTSLTPDRASISVAVGPPSAPFPDQGAPITSYAATCLSVVSGVGQSASASTSPVVVSGLLRDQNYSCTATATNAVGTGPASAAAEVFLPLDDPTAPTITAVTPAGTSVTLAFSPPSDDGGSPVTGYTAVCTSSDGGATGTGSGSASPITVSGLTTEHFYTCTATATNAVGTGPASAPSARFGPPGAPSITAFGIESPTSVKVAFSTVAANGSSVTYTAVCASSNGGVTSTAPGPASPLTVTGLTAGKDYECWVYAANASGTGPNSTTESFVAQVDYLFALGTNGLRGCPDPTGGFGLLGGCLDGFTTQGNDAYLNAPVTDGVNVYWVTQSGPGRSCPIAGNGANCTTVFAGPIGNTLVESFAVAGGDFYFGQQDGTIWRCPANVPWKAGDPIPTGCLKLDTATGSQIDSLIVANGYLYAALNPGSANNSLLWRCPLSTPNGCETWDKPGSNPIDAPLTVGAGYLWVGLNNGIIWRCDLDTANDCHTWDTGGGAITGLSYDGQGTLYAFVAAKPAVTWACPTGTQNACRSVASGIANNYQWGVVAAGAGGVFWAGCSPSQLSPALSAAAPASGNGWPAIWFGTSGIGVDEGTEECNGQAALLLYVPAGGPTSPGSVEISVPLSGDLASRCVRGGAVSATVEATGPYGFSWRRTLDLCRTRRGGVPTLTWGGLDAGAYAVTVHSGKYSGRADATVAAAAATTASVPLARR